MDDVLLNKHAIIKRCLKRVNDEYSGHEAEIATNLTRQDAIVLNIQRAGQAAQDMANRVIRLNQLEMPQNNRESFSLLRDHNFITSSLADTMMKMVGFRNIAVHEYQKLDVAILISIIEKHLPEIEQLAIATMKAAAFANHKS